jgi:aryl-alcohol dehydrogenase-like predicted oxidoreductase
MTAKAIGLQEQHGWARFVTGQMYYSLLGREIEYSAIPHYLDAGIGIMAWSPLAGGFLSGKYTREAPDGGGGRLSRFNFVPFEKEKGYAIVEALKTIARRHDATPANVAMAWLDARPAVSTVLLGISRVEMMAENLKAASITLTPEDQRVLDEVSKIPPPYPDWFNTMMADAQAGAALRR